MKLLVIGVFFASLGVARAQSPFATAHPTNGVKVAPAAAIKAPPTSALVLPPSNDDCAGALPLTGGGPFVFDLTLATNSGVTNSLCLGSLSVDSDVWFTWMAPASGTFEVATCGHTTVDTKVSVFSGVACGAMTPLACDDDGCGLQSRAAFAAVAGSSYTIQLGTFPGATTGAGSFTVLPLAPPPNDDCSAPIAISGAGPFAYDDSLATLGATGQMCVPTGTSTIDHDLWYCWTAPASGSYDVSTRGLTLLDTKIAVYAGCACPTSASIGCNDDVCGTLQSTMTWNANAGTSYLIQIGTFTGAQGGLGAFTIVPTPPPPPGCQYDDGTPENSVGLNSGGAMGWLQRFGTPGTKTLVTQVEAAISMPIGASVSYAVWKDPNDDGNPSDAVLTYLGSGSVSGAPSQVFPVPSLVLDGVFYLGVAVTHASGQYPAPIDQSGCAGAGIAWVVGSTTGALDLATLTAPTNDEQLTDISSLFFGVWLVRGGCSTEAGTLLCGNGDPLRAPCPCGNNGTNPLAGCANSANPAGSSLTSSGFTQLDDVRLRATGMTGTSCLFFCTFGSSGPTGVVFGDGVSCTGTSLLRLRTITFPPGIGSVVSFPDSTGTVTLSNRSGVTVGSGAVREYGTYYRNASAAFCPPQTFNTANTIEIVW